jgi:hypothetical protein
MTENLRSTNHKYKFVEFEKPNFILTDNPILYKKTPLDFQELDKSEYFFPLSDKRGFTQFLQSSNEHEDRQFQNKYAYWYNALAIEQSTKYSVSGDLKILEKSLEFYKYIKENQREEDTKDLLFSRIQF